MKEQNNNIDYYSLTQQLAGSIFGALGAIRIATGQPLPEQPPLLHLRRGQAEAPAWFMVQAAEFDPEPISVAKLRVRDIYASDRIVYALLELMASEKWLEPAGVDEYVLTPTGREIIDTMFNRSQQAILNLEQKYLPDVIQPESIAQLESLLGRIIEASLDGDDPPGNWSLRHSRHRAPAAGDSSPLLNIYQYTADFNAYRDDAHMAAWQPYQIEGYVWETFTFVCDGAATSAQEIDQQLYYRGYAHRDYAAALQDLASRGWLRPVDASSAPPTEIHPAKYQPTKTGLALRQKAEHQTNVYFYAPWNRATPAEITNLYQLLLQLMEALNHISEKVNPQSKL